MIRTIPAPTRSWPTPKPQTRPTTPSRVLCAVLWSRSSTEDIPAAACALQTRLTPAASAALLDDARLTVQHNTHPDPTTITGRVVAVTHPCSKHTRGPADTHRHRRQGPRTAATRRRAASIPHTARPAPTSQRTTVTTSPDTHYNTLPPGAADIYRRLNILPLPGRDLHQHLHRRPGRTATTRRRKHPRPARLHQPGPARTRGRGTRHLLPVRRHHPRTRRPPAGPGTTRTPCRGSAPGPGLPPGHRLPCRTPAHPDPSSTRPGVRPPSRRPARVRDGRRRPGVAGSTPGHAPDGDHRGGRGRDRLGGVAAHPRPVTPAARPPQPRPVARNPPARPRRRPPLPEPHRGTGDPQHTGHRPTHRRSPCRCHRGVRPGTPARAYPR